MNDMELTEEIESIVHGLVAQQAMQDDWWRPRLDAVIAALRRGHERPPSGEMVAEFMPCEAQPNPEPKMVVPIATLDRIMRDCEHGSRIWKECDALLRAYRLAAAEAEGRKS